MKLIDNLKYQLHILEAMANSRADGIKEVNSKLNQIISHLIKIAIISENRDLYLKGWQNEIVNWLDDISFVCNNLKKGGRLKFKDYMLCLQDDLGSERRVQAHITRIKVKWGEVPPKLKPYNLKRLHQTLWAILEAQFKVMSVDMWELETFTENADYILLKQNGGGK